MTEISSHVLDTTAGRPAEGIPVGLETWTGGTWTEVARAVTDADGRVAELGGSGGVATGRHRLVFDLSAREPSFYPEITVTFTVSGEPRLHLPVLLSPYGYTTYRGS